MKLPGFLRRRPQEPDLLAELDRDVKGRTGLYVGGKEIVDRRSAPRPRPESPGLKAEKPIDDPLGVPFVPRPDPKRESGEVGEPL